jgi:stage IV sporulation protein FB
MFLVLPRFRIRVSVFALPSLLVMLWLEGLLPFLILMLSALVHEVGHIIAIRALGYRARRIDILPMGALIVCPEAIPFRDEVAIALAGPIASLAASAVGLLAFAVSKNTYIIFFALVNLMLALFNLLPIAKLDGGKALFCFLQYKEKRSCARICTLASLFSKTLLIMIIALAVVSTGYNLGVILLFFALLVQL